MKPFFQNPYNDTIIHVFPDIPHMLKLTRNLLHDLGEVYVSGFTIPAQWKYINFLHQYQVEVGLRLFGNRITNKHVDYGNFKMKVSLAAQVLSSSLADTLDYLRDHAKLEKFNGSEATSAFCRMFDQGFDVLNSKSHLGQGFKAPLHKDNFMERETWLLGFIDWLKGLQVINTKGGSKVPVYDSRQKKCIIGWIASAHSALSLAWS